MQHSSAFTADQLRYLRLLSQQFPTIQQTATEILRLRAMLNLLMMTFSGNVLPLTLFPDSWQKVITLLPYAQLLDAPIRLYTGEWALSQFPRVLCIQGVWIVLLVALGLYFWRQNQKRIVLQGG